MHDHECVGFLRRVLPGLGFRWKGFRKVRRQVCRRIARRMRDIGFSDPAEYEAFLRDNTEEREVLRSLCRVTISRFWRDRGIWKFLEEHTLPSLAAKAHKAEEPSLRALSLGSASGEEPYTLSVLWHARVAPKLSFRMGLSVLAVEFDGELIARARAGVYPASSVRDVPSDMLALAFTEHEGRYCLKPVFREGIEFLRQDIGRELPEGPFHLVFCRNLVFTYFCLARQQEMLSRIQDILVPGGVLVLGSHERLPAGHEGFMQDEQMPYLYVLEN